MERLTPNLWAYSSFNGDSNGVTSRELDFNMARRSAIIINRIISQMFLVYNTTTGHGVDSVMIQELDVDPDNTDVEFGGTPLPEDVVLDSSRCLRHVNHSDRDTAAGVESTVHSLLIKDFSSEDERKRPISITPLRHHLRNQSALAHFYRGELNIDYFIVELTLEEIGIINASRR